LRFFKRTQWNIGWGLAILSKLIRSGDAFTVTIKCQPCATWGNAMRVHDRYWLDYDTVAFAVLVIALGILELIVLGI
jgi:hypothetical protein